MQVCAHLTDIAKPLAIRVVPIVGGVSAQKHDRLLGYKPPIVVATPGRLWDVMRQGHAHLSDLTYLSFLVLDEADRMVKHGHYEELTHILDRIPAPGSSKQAHAGDALDSSPAAADPETDTTDGTLEDMLKATLAGPLRTYVFSATLTLPSKLKQRLQRGCGGSRGSGAGASFDNLMSRMRFHGKPKVCACVCVHALHFASWPGFMCVCTCHQQPA
jgi:ATP-dependent RNA helicase DDX24/MAK5